MKFNKILKKGIKKIRGINLIVINFLFIGTCIGFYYIDSAFLGSILLIMFIIVTLINNIVIDKLKLKDNSVNDFIYKINEEIDKNLMNLVYPVALIKEAGEIFWCNKE